MNIPARRPIWSILDSQSVLGRDVNVEREAIVRCVDVEFAPTHLKLLKFRGSEGEPGNLVDALSIILARLQQEVQVPVGLPQTYNLRRLYC